ncbi:N4-gp56 family major capsid protein [Actinomadura atramentaria]|uniref:N4-gp56 family major capsid protein n=1 Tax=Actinomadura atramentaria TaxID=1990 RepID=UPI000477697B|nr:N4-gp56 family major capsid protein [Actinomadura atramentaria]
MPSAITGTPFLSASPTVYSGADSSRLSPVIQTIWSKEILFQAMPILRFEQFMVKKTELGVQPGLSINFTRYNNLGKATQLVEGVRMQTNALTATQFSITVAEHGYAIAVSELLLNASFDDVMASGSRLLGRNMAMYLDESARDTLLQASSVLYGRDKYKASQTITNLSPYDPGKPAASRDALTGDFHLTSHTVKDCVETLESKNVPRLGETYVQFVHPHQARKLRDDPEFIEITKYASPGNFMIGEIGRLHDVVFISTTQCKRIKNAAGKDVYQSIVIGDNAAGHAISLPVELRDGGILDFGREHALCWYAIWGLGLITDISVVIAETN